MTFRKTLYELHVIQDQYMLIFFNSVINMRTCDVGITLVAAKCDTSAVYSVMKVKMFWFDHHHDLESEICIRNITNHLCLLSKCTLVNVSKAIQLHTMEAHGGGGGTTPTHT
jgi:hypothetical protein